MGKTKEEKNQYNKEYREKNLERERENDRLYRQAHKEQRSLYNKQYQTINKEKINQRRRQYYLEHQAEIREKVKQYRETHKDQLRQYEKDNWQRDKKTAHRRYLHKTWKKTVIELDLMLLQQGGCCAICKTPFIKGTKKRKPSIDHNHETGQVRGLLCSRCNMHLSFMEDEKLRNAALQYLAKYNSQYKPLLVKSTASVWNWAGW